MAIRLLFPCCSAKIDQVNPNECARAAEHAFVSIAVLVIFAIGSILAAQAFSNGSFKWTAVAAGASCASGLLTYVILRLCSKSQKKIDKVEDLKTETSKTTVEEKQVTAPSKKQIEEPPALSIDWTDCIIEQVLEYPGDLTEKETANLTWKENEGLIELHFENLSSFKVKIWQKDMFESEAEVLVNAANTHLTGGNGIDGALHENGGKDYQDAHNELRVKYGGKRESRKSHASYSEGYAAILPAGQQLGQLFGIERVIVIAGPRGGKESIEKRDSEKEAQLYSCYFNSLLLAHTHGKTSIAFPLISTGIFGFDKNVAARISLRALYDFITHYPDTSLKTISLHYINDSKSVDSYRQALCWVKKVLQ